MEKYIIYNDSLINTNNKKALYKHQVRYEFEKKETFLLEAMENLSFANEYEPESVRDLVLSEKKRELKTLWELKSSEMQLLFSERENAHG